MLTSLCLLVGGAALYNLMKGESMDDEIQYKADDTIYYDTDEDYEQLTYDYFMTLSISEQERYYKENIDLNYWKNDACKGLTTDKHLNARHAAEVARVTGKKFTDRYKTY